MCSRQNFHPSSSLIRGRKVQLDHLFSPHLPVRSVTSLPRIEASKWQRIARDITTGRATFTEPDFSSEELTLPNSIWLLPMCGFHWRMGWYQVGNGSMTRLGANFSFGEETLWQVTSWKLQQMFVYQNHGNCVPLGSPHYFSETSVIWHSFLGIKWRSTNLVCCCPLAFQNIPAVLSLWIFFTDCFGLLPNP